MYCAQLFALKFVYDLSAVNNNNNNNNNIKSRKQTVPATPNF